MKGALITVEALAALLILAGTIFMIAGAGVQEKSRAAEITALMQAEDVAGFIARSGGMEKVGAEELEEVVEELDACARVSIGDEEVFRSECFGGGGLKVSAEYFEVGKGRHAVATVELEKNK